MFNPYSAFPRQTTFTPFTGHIPRGPARAINAPNFGAVGTGRSYVQPPLTAAIFGNAANAASIAQGAAGGIANFNRMQSRPSYLHQAAGVVDRRGLSARSKAFSAQVSNRGEQVIKSDASPLSVDWDYQTAPPLQGYRANEPWDALLDPGAQPRFDPGGRLDAPLTAAAAGGSTRSPTLNRMPQVTTIGGNVRAKSNQRGMSPEGMERFRSQIFSHLPD